MLRTIMLGLVTLFFLTAIPAPGIAGQDQNDAQKARKQGDLIPYGQIARRAVKQFGGRVVGQKMRQTGSNSWVYELRLLMEDGKVLQVVMDAKTGRVISTRGR